MPVGVGRRRPHRLSAAEQKGRPNQVDAAELLITLPGQPCADEVSLACEKQNGIAVGRQMNRPLSLVAGDSVIFPETFA